MRKKGPRTQLSFQTYRMPDGQETYDQVAYVAAWRALGDGITQELCWKLTAFDPDLRFRKPNGIREDVPTEIAALVNLLRHKMKPE
jgi:hypothetical protein